jgi:hypothetical protein
VCRSKPATADKDRHRSMAGAKRRPTCQRAHLEAASRGFAGRLTLEPGAESRARRTDAQSGPANRSARSPRSAPEWLGFPAAVATVRRPAGLMTGEGSRRSARGRRSPGPPPGVGFRGRRPPPTRRR